MGLISDLFKGHPVWGCLTLAVLVWYSTVTIYVGIRGVLDIRQMLGRLREQKDRKPGHD